MWILLLNDMRSPSSQTMTPVARADTKEELIYFMKTHTVTAYYEKEERGDGGTYQWQKSFAKGSPLEWYNQPSKITAYNHYKNAGTLKGCIERGAERGEAWWKRMVEPVPVLKDGKLTGADDLAKPDVFTFE